MDRRLPGHGRARAFAFALAWLAMASSAAAADPATDPAPPAPPPAAPPAAAPAARPAEEVPVALEAVVVGQRPRNQVARDSTASATVIRADEYAGEAKGVADLLSTAPGVAVDDYGGLGQLATASIRGSTANGVLVLLDGIPLRTAFGGAVDLSSIPRGWIDRIEVVRGAEGAHYGAGALGGVVNVVTARPRAGAAAAELGGGSFGTASAAADAAGLVGPATALVAAVGERTDGDFPYLFQPTPSAPSTPIAAVRGNDGAWRAGFLSKVNVPVGGSNLDAVALLSGGRRELPGWPYALTPDDWQSDGRAILAARFAAPAFTTGLQLAGRLSARSEWLDAFSAGNLIRERTASAGLALEAGQRHPGGRLRAEASVDASGARGDGLDGTRQRWSQAASLSDELLLAGDRLRLGPALRVERDGSFAGWSARLGGSLRVAGPLSLRASAGRTFRAPSDAELFLATGLTRPNPALAPELGLGGDAALVLDGGPVLASVGGHATLYDDLVYYQPVSFGQLQPFNAGKALVRGLEAEAATVPLLGPAALTLQASYTLLDAEILRGVEGTLGKQVPHRARHRLYARAAVAPGRFAAHAELHLVGRQYADDRNLREIPAARVWNAGAGVRLARDPALRLDLLVRNLLDDRTLQDPFGNPLPGRSFLVTLSGSTKG